MKKSIMSSLAVAMLAISQHSLAMTALNDQELAKVEGQALLSMGIQQGANQIDELGNPINQQGVKFYKLGLEAEMELNANIRKLQLGCGGVNNSIHNKPGCDIDIDNIALSGLPGANYTSDQRAASSAVITNPFVEFAIENADSSSTRRVLGFRLSAEKIQGLLTMGTENTETPNGINSFSGYMRTKELTGTAMTKERQMTFADTNKEIHGIVKGCLDLLVTCVNLDLDLHYVGREYDFKLESTAAPFTIAPSVVTGSRMTDVELYGKGTVNELFFAGPLTALVLGELLPLEKQITGSIINLETDITVNQSLGLVHALYLNNPMSLSLQEQSVLWPGASVAAKRGWWMALEDEVDLGSASPSNPVDISNEVLIQTIAGINKDLTEKPRDCGNLVSGCIGGSALAVNQINNPTLLDFPLKNLKLSGQDFKSNCFGGHKFC